MDKDLEAREEGGGNREEEGKKDCMKISLSNIQGAGLLKSVIGDASNPSSITCILLQIINFYNSISSFIKGG